MARKRVNLIVMYLFFFLLFGYLIVQQKWDKNEKLKKVEDMFVVLDKRLAANSVKSITIILLGEDNKWGKDILRKFEGKLIELGNYRYSVVESNPERLKIILKRLNMEESDLYIPEQVARLGKFIRADAIFLCKIDSLGLEIQFKVILSETAVIVFSDVWKV